MSNINLVDFPESNLHLILKWRLDNRINQFLRHGLQTLNDIQKWYSDYFSGEMNKLYSINYNNTPIGYFTIEHIDKLNKNCEFGIVIGEGSLHQKGIGLSVVAMMLDVVFNQMAMHRVYAIIQNGNVASVNCFSKAGFLLEGRMRDSRLINNEYRDILLYSILENEWLKIPKPINMKTNIHIG